MRYAPLDGFARTIIVVGCGARRHVATWSGVATLAVDPYELHVCPCPLTPPRGSLVGTLGLCFENLGVDNVERWILEARASRVLGAGFDVVRVFESLMDEVPQANPFLDLPSSNGDPLLLLDEALGELHGSELRVVAVASALDARWAHFVLEWGVTDFVRARLAQVCIESADVFDTTLKVAMSQRGAFLMRQRGGGWSYG